jgi:transposase
MESTQPVIVLCPCCASAIDALAGPHTQTFTCVSCGQTWQMVVDADRYAAHSLS